SISDYRVVGDSNLISWLNENAVVFHFTDPNLGSLKILENPDVQFMVFVYFADKPDYLGMSLMVSMGKIKSENINSGHDQFCKGFLIITSRPYGSQNLCFIKDRYSHCFVKF